MNELISPAMGISPVLWPTLLLMLIYGVRYIVFASLMFIISRPQFNIGRAHFIPPTSFKINSHVQREIMYSFMTVLVFGAVNAILYGTGWIHASQLYFQLSDHSMAWFYLSIPVMLIIHDTLFYWLHRAMHTRLLFNVMHKVHHQSIYPTAFAAYSFHPTEALAEALIVVVIIYIMPSHPLAILAFQTISTAINTYGHCGREFYPIGTDTHWLGRWINTSTTHAAHHIKGRSNYGLYLLFWDRVMGTFEPPRK